MLASRQQSKHVECSDAHPIMFSLLRDENMAPNSEQCDPVSSNFHCHYKIDRAMSEDDLFLETQHPESKRLGIFEDDGTSAWLYLTERNSRKPIADAWVHNRIPAPPPNKIQSYRGSPPPAAIGYVNEQAMCHSPSKHEWSFLWSSDGESIAIIKDGSPVACIVANEKRGYSRCLIKDGPWGHIWSDTLFAQVFGDE